MNLSSSCSYYCVVCTILHMLWRRPSIRTQTFTGKISTTSTTSLVSSQLTSSSLALTKRSQELHGRSIRKPWSFYTPGTIQSSFTASICLIQSSTYSHQEQVALEGTAQVPSYVVLSCVLPNAELCTVPIMKRVSSFALSMEESTAANADTLRLELKKTMTEILDDGGVSKDRGETDGALVAVDEAVRILNRLREVESKMPDSDTSSSSPASLLEVPKEFKCMLSRTIMSEPVVIASGQTYEKRYIQQWLMYKVTCPKTKEVLSHRLWSPNHVIAELITQWCQVNKYDLPKPSDAPIGLFPDDIDLLLHRISSPSSVEDQTGAANELRRQTKRFADVTAFFVAEIPDSITRLLTPLSALGEAIDSNPGLQKNIITALLYISSLEENKTAVAQHPLAIPLLTKSLKQGTAKTRRNSANALWELSKLDSNKIIIGNLETLEALVHVIKEDHFTAAIGAAYAVFQLCFIPENRDKVVSEGLVPALINRIKERSFVYIYFALLSLMTIHKGVIEEMEDLGFVDDMCSILRNTSCSVTEENGVSIVLLRMCGLNTGDRDRERTRLKLIKEEEDKYSTFTKFATQGSQCAVAEAEAVLQWIKRSGTGEEP